MLPQVLPQVLPHEGGFEAVHGEAGKQAGFDIFEVGIFECIGQAVCLVDTFDLPRVVHPVNEDP